MPIVEVTVTHGRPSDELRALMARLHADVVETLAVADDSVRVILREVPADRLLVGGRTIAERRSAESAGAERGGE